MSLADELTKLNQLRQDGVLNEEEFQTQKKKLIEGSSSAQSDSSSENLKWDDIPVWKKTWFQMLMGLIIYPAGIILLVIFPSYSKKKGGLAKRDGKGTKALMLFLLTAGWLMFISRGSSGIPKCDASEVEDTLGEIVSNNPASRLVNLELIEVTKVDEISYDKDRLVRTCRADLILNSGRESVRFKISKAKGAGEFLVEMGN